MQGQGPKQRKPKGKHFKVKKLHFFASSSEENVPLPNFFKGWLLAFFWTPRRIQIITLGNFSKRN